jgi:asparagine synthase (glutamine-hydrolysing)
MTMASGLEARVPFLDRALVEWAFQQPGRLKVRRGVGKLPLRRALASDLPLTASLPKHGFNVPLGEWLRGPLREYLVDSLSVDVVRRRGYFDSRAVDRLVAAHIEGRGDYSAKILPLLALEAWLGENGVK